MNDCKLQAQAQFSWEASLPASFEDCRLQSADTSEYLGIRTRPFRCCCLGHVFGTAAASFGSVVITKRKLKTNGYALHIKQLLFVALFFFISYFFGGYCIAFWAFLYLGRKINCATGATTTAVEEEEQAQTQRCIFGPEESLPHCKKILYNFQNCIHYKLYVLSYLKKGEES